jgi:hypothetical protein
MWVPTQISTGLKRQPISDKDKEWMETHPTTRGKYNFEYIGEDAPLLVGGEPKDIEPPFEVKAYEEPTERKKKRKAGKE